MKAIHHSLIDWDYSSPAPYLTTDYFVSAPTALAAVKNVSLDRQGWAVCNLAEALNIPDGRVICQNWMRPSGMGSLHYFYRAQALPATAVDTPQSCYQLTFTTSTVDLYRKVAGVPTLLYHYVHSPDWTWGAWYRFRHTWWQFIDPDLIPVLRHTLEIWQGGAWVTLFTVDDSVNSFAGSAVNKVGVLLLHGNSIYLGAVDDTEIWKRAE